MLTAIKGIYTEGKIQLEEYPAMPDNTEVVVTFLEDRTAYRKVRLGSLKGKISIPEDFDEPLDIIEEYLDKEEI